MRAMCPQSDPEASVAWRCHFVVCHNSSNGISPYRLILVLCFFFNARVVMPLLLLAGGPECSVLVGVHLAHMCVTKRY